MMSYCRNGAQGAPANRIHGSAFDWDPVHGIARAMGEVHRHMERAGKSTS